MLNFLPTFSPPKRAPARTFQASCYNSVCGSSLSLLVAISVYKKPPQAVSYSVVITATILYVALDEYVMLKKKEL
jgi:hypothetical protein